MDFWKNLHCVENIESCFRTFGSETYLLSIWKGFFSSTKETLRGPISLLSALAHNSVILFKIQRERSFYGTWMRQILFDICSFLYFTRNILKSYESSFHICNFSITGFLPRREHTARYPASQKSTNTLLHNSGVLINSWLIFLLRLPFEPTFSSHFKISLFSEKPRFQSPSSPQQIRPKMSNFSL